MTYAASQLSLALLERPIEDVNVDWERFGRPGRPVELVVVGWDEHGSTAVVAGGDPRAGKSDQAAGLST
jgi:hypothetical protein